MKKKLMSLLLAILMVIGIMPTMVQTVSADNTETLLTTITATAKEQASYSTANVATVSFSYTTGGSSAYIAIWGWWGYGWSATVNAAEGYTITKCIFYDDADRTATDSEAPFVVETTEEDKTPQVNGTPILAYTSKGIKKIEVYGYVTPVATYNVTVTPGSNMTKTETSGAESQTVSDAIEDVVYTANEGYYFPENYSVDSVNGISVTRDSYTQITVSGTPSAETEITLTAPTAKSKPTTPNASASNCTTIDNNDGKLTGVTTTMEYKKSDADSWTDVKATEITGLAPGTYYVRVKETDTALASDNQELTIKKFISYTVTFKVVNGFWDNETTTDIPVTLTGLEGDELKLTADQIPAVGNKPNETYKAGSWDVTPSTDTVITKDTTYTYTYAQKETINPTVSIEGWTYGETPKSPSVSGNTGDGEVTYSYATKGSDEYSSIVPTNAGEYTVKATIEETADYLGATDTADFTIAKADSSAATVTGNDRTYDGTQQDLITVTDEPIGGTMYYCIGEDEDTPTAFDTDIPKATDAKTYYVFYHVKGDDNHNDSDPTCVTVTISPVNKDALNEIINEAEEYYNSIKDNDDYKEVADKLKEAIDNAKAVADNDNQTVAQVDEAITTLNDALDKAKEDKKDVDDTIAANEVADMVSKLPNPNDVTAADKDAIEEARKAYDILTPEQKAKLPVDTKDKLEQVEEALKEAQDQEAADEVADMVSKLPNPNDVKKDDTDAIEEARKAYDGLTDNQKAKLPVDTKDKLEQVEEALLDAIEGIKYSNIEGDGSSWVKGSTSGSTFTFKRNVNDHKTFNEFDGIKVDGNTVATSNYSYREGSVIINLNPSYLETLSVGNHTLTAVFKDGNDVTVSFKVLAKTTPSSDSKKYIVPKTGID